ncbi:MAG: chitobiase/beta-hexosaminidase C-terminal domain-containing protein, partial [Muribaculaceae bacterium]|nr:chitobiase/beta-hexosaminidase C-terminal domain-containing protein [Muribaculaceae bacterium]
MKKLLLFAAALAMAFAVKAETLSVGVSGASVYAGSAWEDGPVNFGYSNSGMQVLYTPDQLQAAIDNNGAVKSLTFSFYNEMEFSDIDVSATAYLDVVDFTSFEADAANKYHYAPFTTDHAATVSETISMLDYYYDNFDLTFNFAEPIQLEAGKALMLTVLASCDPCAEGPHYVAGYCTEPQPKSTRVLYFSSDSQAAADGLVAGEECKFTDYAVPAVTIGYDKVEIVKVPCEAPVFAPESGTALGPNDAITITCAVEGAEIYYSIDGSEPTELYVYPINVSEPTTVKAMASHADYLPSEVVEASYTLNVTAAPAVDPAVGKHLGSNEKVTLVCDTEGAAIYYGIDGDPAETLYTEPFSISKACTVKAKAQAEGAYPSEIVTFDFTIRKAERPSFATREYSELNQGEAVLLNVPANFEAKYSFSADMADAKAYDPEAGIVIDSDCTIWIVGTRENYYDSDPVKAEFKYNDIAAYKLGGYDTTRERFAGTNFYNSPLIFVYNNSATQTIYTAEEMAPMAGKSITKLSYVYNNEMCLESYSSTARVFLQELDSDDFVIEPYSQKELWYAYDAEHPAAAADINIDFIDCFGYDGELTFTLDQPFACSGKALLVTVINEAPMYIDNSSGVAFYSYMDPEKRSAVFYSDYYTFEDNQAEDDLIRGVEYNEFTRRDKPCTKMEYTITDGLASVAAPEKIQVADGKIKTDAEVSVYTVSGALVAKGCGEISLPAGIYVA